VSTGDVRGKNFHWFLVLSVLFLSQHKRKKKGFKLSACWRRVVGLNMCLTCVGSGVRACCIWGNDGRGIILTQIESYVI